MNSTKESRQYPIDELVYTLLKKHPFIYELAGTRYYIGYATFRNCSAAEDKLYHAYLSEIKMIKENISKCAQHAYDYCQDGSKFLELKTIVDKIRMDGNLKNSNAGDELELLFSDLSDEMLHSIFGQIDLYITALECCWRAEVYLIKNPK